MDISNLPSVPSSRPHSPMAVWSLGLGVLSFIPYVGFALGGMALILGWRARKKFEEGEYVGRNSSTLGIVFGVMGIILSIVWILNFFLPGSDFGSRKYETVQHDLLQNAGALELYRSAYGEYPESIVQLQDAGFNPIITDAYFYPYAYGVSEERQAYSLLSVGPDGVYGTEDDVVFGVEMLLNRNRTLR